MVLVQLDGSFHDWLEQRGPGGCLMDMVDDATNQTLARMGKEETIWAATQILQSWISQYGVPRALYTDWINFYRRKATPAEQLRGEVTLTQFGRMCQKLGIRILSASSPQAKGRVERRHGVHQDRLIKKMRRKGIASYEAANEYLEQEYLLDHNRRFSRPAAKPEDYHGRKPAQRELREIFRLETECSISNDWVVRHEGRWLQLHPKLRRYGPTKNKAVVCEWEDGSTEVYYRGERIGFSELKELPKKTPASVAPGGRAILTPKPKPDHPWRQSFRNMKPWTASQAMAAPVVGMRTSASP